MVLANSKTHIEPLDTFHDAGAHDLDILLKGTIVSNQCNNQLSPMDELLRWCLDLKQILVVVFILALSCLGFWEDYRGRQTKGSTLVSCT